MLLAFDCDGVLVDSEIIASKVDAEHLTRAGYKITPEEVTRRFAGMTGKAIFEQVEAELGHPLPADFRGKVKEDLAARIARDVQAVPGIADVLDRLEGPHCVCSNSTSEQLQVMLTKTKLYDSFKPHIFSAVEVGDRQPKPAPNVYLYAAKEFGTAPREVLVIEDSVFGVRAAKAAGMRVLGFTGGRHSWLGHADLLTEAGAETVIKRFSDLPKIAEALMSWDGLVE